MIKFISMVLKNIKLSSVVFFSVVLLSGCTIGTANVPSKNEVFEPDSQKIAGNLNQTQKQAEKITPPSLTQEQLEKVASGDLSDLTAEQKKQLETLVKSNEVNNKEYIMKRSRDNKRMSDLKNIQTTLELYFSVNKSFPQGSGVTIGKGNYTCLNDQGFGPDFCAKAYGFLPADPGQNTNYIYTATSNRASYTVIATLEGEVNGMTGQITLTPKGIFD